MICSFTQSPQWYSHLGYWIARIPLPFARGNLICADKNTPYVHISLIIVTSSLWFSSLLRCLAYVPSAYVSDISRLRQSIANSNVIRLLSSTTWHSRGLWIPSYRAYRPLSSSPSLFGGIFEFRGTYEVKKINLATEKSTSVLSRSREKSASRTIGLDIFIKSLHMKCRFMSAAIG